MVEQCINLCQVFTYCPSTKSNVRKDSIISVCVLEVCAWTFRDLGSVEGILACQPGIILGSMRLSLVKQGKTQHVSERRIVLATEE